uniref:NUDIX hydrolase N-terminal domain-containing protein n=1 Tax=Ndongobacter massiliensis TaxID=1871025 RepID=UPI0009F81226|nr:NUDIX hydrolase N-terminal domain-containing protein [Ndongobacter massiliensis]
MREKEWWDLYDRRGVFVGRHQRGVPLPAGCFHHMVCIFVVNSRREVLMTKRAPEKSYAGYWELTAGSVLAGEALATAAARELAEETGIVCEKEALTYLDRFFIPELDGWMSFFFVQRDVPLEDLHLQPGETVDARWISLDPQAWNDPLIIPSVRDRFLLFWRDLRSLTEDPATQHDWTVPVKALCDLAQEGLAYTKDPFDRDRFERLQYIAAQILAKKTGRTARRMLGFLSEEKGYPTPKVEVRAAIVERGKILLVHERMANRWSLPGGWCDSGMGIGETAEKECLEEAGIVVQKKRLIAIENRSQYDYDPYWFEVIKCYILCERKDPSVSWTALQEAFSPNTETDAIGFFAPEELPELATDRVTRRSILQCMKAAADDHWSVVFD